MKTVTVSAVGHETDFSLTDFAADARSYGHPTAAAEMLSFDTDEIAEQIISTIKYAAKTLTARTDALYNKVLSSTKEVNYICKAKLDSYTQRINKAVTKAELLTEAKLSASERKTENPFVQALRPQPALISWAKATSGR